MVLGGGAGSFVTVSPPLLPSVNMAPPPRQILDLDTQRNIEPQQHHLVQQHIQQQQQQQQQQQHMDEQQQLMPLNSGDFMTQINSAEIRSLLASDAVMTDTFVEAHLSENLSSNLNIIDPNPAVSPPSSISSPPNIFDTASSSNSNNLNHPLSNQHFSHHHHQHQHHQQGAGGASVEPTAVRVGAAFLPNIVAVPSTSSGGCNSRGGGNIPLTVADSNKETVVISAQCDSLNTPTPSSGSLTYLKSELQMFNDSMR